MIPIEWVERSQLHPSGTQLFRCISAEATHIGTDQWYSIHLELQYSCKKAKIHVIPKDIDMAGGVQFYSLVSHGTG